MNSQKSSGGIWMLVGLVVLLAAPVVIGHFTIATATASPAAPATN